MKKRDMDQESALIYLFHLCNASGKLFLNKSLTSHTSSEIKTSKLNPSLVFG